VGALGLTATVSYGILSYGFAVFIAPMGAELGWSKAEITGAFSLAQLIAGVAAIPVGRWVDRHGARALMTAGSALAAILLVAWSEVHSLAAFYALWAAMGLAMAAVLYEPAFAVVATWFAARRGRALTVLTFVGGFASVIFVPLATFLVERHGWRAALLWLAAVYATLTILPHALVLRRRPADIGLVPDGASPDGATRASGRTPRGAAAHALSVPAREAVRRRSFRWLAAAFALSALTTTAVSVHLVPLLLERGYGAAFAGAAMGVLGLMALPGRLVFTPLGSRWRRSAVTASIFALGAIACMVLLLTRHPAAVWAFVVLFGAGFGAITPARAALVAELYGPLHYGKIAGVLALLVSLARAVAPVGASLLYSLGGGVRHGYDVVMFALLALCVASGVAVLAAGDRDVRAAIASTSAHVVDGIA
jgi:MFS family permease